MRDGSPVGTKHECSMTALPAAGSEVEVKPVLAGIPSGPPKKLPVVHEPFQHIFVRSARLGRGDRSADRVALVQVHGPGPRRGDEGALPGTGGGRVTAGTQRVEVALPARPSKRASLIDGEGFGCQHSQGEVDRLALSRELIAPHYFGARSIVDVHGCSRHVRRPVHRVTFASPFTPAAGAEAYR